MTPEGKVKRRVTDVLKRHGVYYFFPMTGGFGKSGVPDIVACVKGKFVGIECKAGKNDPTPLQSANLKQITESGGLAMVIRESNFANFEEYIGMLCGKK